MPGERIRVAHVITRMIVGGAQETVLLAAALADRDRFDPVVVCGPQTGSEGSLHDEVRRRGVELVIVPELVREVDLLADARVVPALTRLFRERRFDVVHTNSSKAGIVGRVAAHRAAVPAVHTVHGWPFHDRQRRTVSAFWKLLERRTASLARHLIVVAEADRTKGLAAGIGRPEQYRVIRSGLELAAYGVGTQIRDEVRAELGISRHARVVGSVGRLSPQKDPLTLVRAAAQVLLPRPDARLILVGDGPLSGQVEREVSALGIARQVVQTGLRSDVPRLLNAMDVFALSSQWEGLPRTLLQATAVGVPVVATDADGVRDVVQDGSTGLLVPRGDVEALGRAVARLLDEPQVAAGLAAAAMGRLAEFDADRMVRALEALYLEAAA
ncbi:MAG: glycosyltransferase family 4 protein [Actinobacteria bacterium]|nr:glycosyltransferase family 4 protein [Actinomycetota bacterium]